MAERVRFTLDGRPAEAEAGTSLLAALWNAGLRAVRTSVSGEARGPLCGMGTCFECRVTVDGEPHRRACLEPLRGGMDVRTAEASHAGPSERARDGRSRLAADVVVVGGGPAGIAAAIHAAEAGARTLLLDEQARPGGQIWRGEPPSAARGWLDRLARSGATVLSGATVVDAPGPNALLVEKDGLPQRIGFERLVLATGARELFLPFPGWTLPGVVGAGGAQALLKAGGRFDGLRVVVAGSGPLLLAVAATLRASGARVVGIAEQAPFARLAAFGASLWRHPHRVAEGLAHAATLRGVPYRTGTWVREAHGDARLERVVLSGAREGDAWECDVLACGFGLVPNLELPRLLGCETTADGVVVDAAQRTSRAGTFATGELCGIAGVDHALVTGTIAGLAAAGRETTPALARLRAREAAFAARLSRAFSLRGDLLSLPRPDTIGVPVRGRALRPPRRRALGARGEALHARRHGRLPGPRVRDGTRLPARLPARQRPLPARAGSRRGAGGGGRRRAILAAMKWQGVLPAITTPFKPDFSVDADLLVGQVDALVRAGCTGVVALGSLGEGGSLSFDEKKAVLRLCREALAGRAPLVAGVAALTTAEAIRLAELGRRHGLRRPHGPAALRLQGRLARDANALRRGDRRDAACPACSTTTRSPTGPTSIPSRWSTSRSPSRTSWRSRSRARTSAA